jgi:hypothetical protein
VFVEAKMLKKLMISAAISALMVSGALAQANPPAAAQAHPPAASDGAKFIAAQSQDQWVFSKFKGTDVLGPDNAHIGNVNDLLMDRHGKVLGLIVGVGGFLGIGEKSVAIDMSAFQAVTPETGTTGAGGQGAGGATSSSNDPTAVKLKVTWTKEQLQSAPDFQYFKPPRPAAPTTGMAPRPTSPSPSQRQ